MCVCRDLLSLSRCYPWCSWILSIAVVLSLTTHNYYIHKESIYSFLCLRLVPLLWLLLFIFFFIFNKRIQTSFAIEFSHSILTYILLFWACFSRPAVNKMCHVACEKKTNRKHPQLPPQNPTTADTVNRAKKTAFIYSMKKQMKKRIHTQIHTHTQWNANDEKSPHRKIAYLLDVHIFHFIQRDDRSACSIWLQASVHSSRFVVNEHFR